MTEPRWVNNEGRGNVRVTRQEGEKQEEEKEELRDFTKVRRKEKKILSWLWRSTTVRENDHQRKRTDSQ